MYHSFLIHSSADGHLGCFSVLAIINSAAINIGVPVSLSILVFSVCMPSSGIAGSYGSSISSFWCFWTVVLEKTLESSLDCKEIQPVHHKGDQSWVFIGRTDAEAETPILWPPDAKGWLIWKDPDAGKDWRQEDKGWDGRMASPTQWTCIWADTKR